MYSAIGKCMCSTWVAPFNLCVLIKIRHPQKKKINSQELVLTFIPLRPDNPIKPGGPGFPWNTKFLVKIPQQSFDKLSWNRFKTAEWL